MRQGRGEMEGVDARVWGQQERGSRGRKSQGVWEGGCTVEVSIGWYR